jgi:hypothetical protein
VVRPPIVRRIADGALVSNRSNIRAGGYHRRRPSDRFGTLAVLHVYNLAYVIAVNAERGRSIRAPSNLMLGPCQADLRYRLQQGAGRRARLNQAVVAATIQGFINPYLATHDSAFLLPLADLVPRQAVVNHRRTSPA